MGDSIEVGDNELQGQVWDVAGPPPKHYICPKCGTQGLEFAISLRLVNHPEKGGYFCFNCLLDLIALHVPLMEEKP